MEIQEALHEIGVREETLSAEEKTFLDTNGYLPLHGLLTPERTATMATRLVEVAEAEAAVAGTEFKQEPGTIRLANLADKDPLFEICFTHPKVLAAIAHVLQNDLKLSSLNGRFALPGEGLQALHCDWREAVEPGAYQVCNSIWLFDDFTEENGATRVVPGSHTWEKTPQDALDDPKAPHPDQVILAAPAGTVVIFNSHTWHGGTLNRTNKPRRAMHSYFTRRHQPQQTDQRKWLSAATLARLSPAAQCILDVA